MVGGVALALQQPAHGYKAVCAEAAPAALGCLPKQHFERVLHAHMAPCAQRALRTLTGVFATLTRQEIAVMMQLARELEFARTQVVYREGAEECNLVYVVLEGDFALCMQQQQQQQ